MDNLKRKLSDLKNILQTFSIDVLEFVNLLNSCAAASEKNAILINKGVENGFIDCRLWQIVWVGVVLWFMAERGTLSARSLLSNFRHVPR